MPTNESLCNRSTVLFSQNVRSLPNGVLFRIHGIVQLGPRYYVRDSWIHRYQRIRAKDIFHGKNRLKSISLNIIYTIIYIVSRTMWFPCSLWCSRCSRQNEVHISSFVLKQSIMSSENANFFLTFIIGSINATASRKTSPTDSILINLPTEFASRTTYDIQTKCSRISFINSSFKLLYFMQVKMRCKWILLY